MYKRNRIQPMRSSFVLLLFFSFSAFANSGETCLPSITIESFTSLMKTTKDQFFPELNNVSINVSTFRSDAYFLQAQPRIKTLVKNRIKRQYSVQLNLKLLECPPREDALKAILVHELEHVKDYTGWSSAKIAKHGAHYSTSMNLKVAYERQTDRKVLEKGLHIGLAGYREWVYQWLTPEELSRKRRIYLTPEEILSNY